MSDFLHSRFGRWSMAFIWLGSVLRLYSLGTAQLWYDEIFTLWLGRLPFDRMLEATAGDVHPPLWYIVEWVVAHISDSEFALRFPAALASIAGLLLLIPLGRRLRLGNTALLIGLAFMAFSPFQLYYAQEARMYALLQAEIMVALIAMLDRRWWLLSLASTAIIYTHNYGLVYCAVIYAAALVSELQRPVVWSAVNLQQLPWRYKSDQANFVAILASGGNALLLYVPWIPSVASQFGNMDKWWQQPTTLGGFIQPLEVFIWNNSLLGLFQTIGQIIAYGLVLLALVLIVKRRNIHALWLTAFCFAPMVISVVTEQFSHPTFLYRTFIGSVPALYLLIGWALSELDQTKRKLALAVLVPLGVMAVVTFYPVSQLKGNVVVMDEQIKWHYGDVIYHMNSGSVVDFYYRYHDNPRMWQYVHPSMEGDIGTLSSRTMKALGLVEIKLDKIKFDRAWLVYSTGPTLGIVEDETAAALVERYRGELMATASIAKTHMYDGQLWLLRQP